MFAAFDPTKQSLFRNLFATALLLIASATVSYAADKKADGTQHVSREALITQLSEETGIAEDELRTIIAPARFRPDIIKRMNRQWEAQPYVRYRPLFIKPSMQKRGNDFIAAHRALFDKAEKKYSVDKAIIAAILGIETRFGEAHGNKPVLDSLYTLSTGYPRRARFFRQQLGAIIEISRKDKLNLPELKGSYAGAFGSIQFIPTSFRDYAVDGDGDGIRDVFHSKADIIESVANYFQKHGWQQGRPSAQWLPMGVHLNQKWQKLSKAHKPTEWVTLGELRKAMPRQLAGIGAPWRDDDKVSIIRMQTSKGLQAALIHHNFQVIMRYNPAFNYAMAVTEIAAMWERELFAVD